MNTREQWNALSERDRVRYLLEKVIGCFVLEQTAQGWLMPEFPRGVHAPKGFHWPIAFWNTDCKCWGYKDIGDNGVTFLDPLDNMNDAWKIVRKMNEPQISGETSYGYYHNFIERLKEIVGSDMFFDLFYCDKDGDHLTPERICQAAYLAVDEEFC